MGIGEEIQNDLSFANRGIFKILDTPDAIQAGKHRILLFAFCRFLLAEDRMLILDSREHSWRWQK